ncbi:glycosyltransferase family 2 protein [Aestuariivirga sp.]|uniref:glycosyltransferase family 2 protein n=1 Tax=Aestuariivirga sp. TaxID=2650926 RepID=UPI003918E293
MNDLSKLQSQFLLARGPRVSLVLAVRNVAETITGRLAEVAAEAELANIKLGEIIVVDDHSDDLTWATLQSEAWRDRRLRPMRLRKQFGVEEAREAGVLAATGDIVITLEPDAAASAMGQLEALVEAGNDVVIGYRSGQATGVFSLLRRLTGLQLRNPLGGTAAYRREVLAVVAEKGTALAHLPFAARRLGYQAGEMEIKGENPVGREGGAGLVRVMGALSGIYGTERLCGLAVVLGLVLVSAAAAVPLLSVLTAQAMGVAAPYGLLSLMGVMLMFCGLQLIGMALLGGLVLAHGNHRNRAGARIAETMPRNGARD